MEINQILAEYDQMFGRRSLSEIETFLVKKIEEAYEKKEYFCAVTLLNEMMGFCRDTGQKKKGIFYCEQVVKLMDQLKMKGSIEYATTLLNVANAERAFGLLEASQKNYQTVENMYKGTLESRDFHYASLYNNWSLLCQEQNRFEEAENMLRKALNIVDQYPEAVMEQATTRTNLAATLLRISQQKEEEREVRSIYDGAMEYLRQALDIYEKEGGRDFHYSAALAAMGEACYIKKNYREASEYYKKAMDELEKHVGKTNDYKRLEKNYRDALQKMESLDISKEQKTETIPMFSRHMERCRAFYETYGISMIKKQFPDYETRIAVGLVGEGSDCFGFDDAISKDHDYEVGFCLWICKEDSQAIGMSLQEAYEKLIETYGEGDELLHSKKNSDTNQRRGVFIIEDFYEGLLGISLNDDTFLNSEIWMKVPEERLAVATNGVVFRDDFGRFTSIRNALKAYYPEEIWFAKLAEQIHRFSQNGQYNYARMMARKDPITAAICIGNALKSAMSICYLLNCQYAPYYKWMRRGMEEQSCLSDIIPILDKIAVAGNQEDAWEKQSYEASKINQNDKIAVLFEEVAAKILSELNRQVIISGTDSFLDQYCGEIATLGRIEKEKLIDRIIRMEWNQFDQVKNEGGRAECQDDWNTFSLMRKSQYRTWTKGLLSSYDRDLTEADKDGWNLITEKYARMMESTSPRQYAKIKERLIERSQERITIQEEIIKIQVEWMEEFASQYPKMAENARHIHSDEDTEWDTSYETYLRGELGTYSEKTFLLYGRFIVSMKQKGENLAYRIMEQTAKLYGYQSVEEAERRLNDEKEKSTID